MNKAASQKRPILQRLVVDFRKNGLLYLLIAPVVLGFIVFKFVPLYGSIIAFNDYSFMDGILGSPWVGLDNFRKFFTDPYFGRIFFNTLILGTLTLIISYPLPICLALALNEVRRRHERFKKLIQSITYLPYFVATVVVIGLVFDIFRSTGFVNQIITSLGAKPVNFLTSTAWFRPLYVGTYVWQTLGWSSILYLAALTTIPVDQYEAAMVDGANRWQQIIYITIPGIIPVARILFILAVGDIINVGFERAFLLQSPSTYAVSDVIQTYVYRRGLISNDFSYAAAVGLFNSTLAFALVWLTNWIVKHIGSESQGIW